jgi:hypothetical protein
MLYSLAGSLDEASFSMTMSFLGQISAHKPHPLQKRKSQVKTLFPFSLIHPSGQTDIQSLHPIQLFCWKLGRTSVRQEPVLFFRLEPDFAINGPNIDLPLYISAFKNIIS